MHHFLKGLSIKFILSISGLLSLILVLITQGGGASILIPKHISPKLPLMPLHPTLMILRIIIALSLARIHRCYHMTHRVKSSILAIISHLPFKLLFNSKVNKIFVRWSIILYVISFAVPALKHTESDIGLSGDLWGILVFIAGLISIIISPLIFTRWSANVFYWLSLFEHKKLIKLIYALIALLLGIGFAIFTIYENDISLKFGYWLRVGSFLVFLIAVFFQQETG